MAPAPASVAPLPSAPSRSHSRASASRLLGGTVNARTIDVQVTRLRRKMEPDPGYPRYLQTVRGQGYRLTGE